MKTSSTLKAAQTANELREKGFDVIDLTVGEPGGGDGRTAGDEGFVDDEPLEHARGRGRRQCEESAVGKKNVRERLTISTQVRSRSPWMAFLLLRPAFHVQPIKGRLCEHAAAAPSASR